MGKLRLVAAIAVGLIIVLTWTAGASAAPQQLDCVLTDVGTQPGSVHRPIAVTFDANTNTLKAQDGAETITFSSVSISNVTVNGANAGTSIGIDRSSLGIVWQTYGSASIVIEYGKCRLATSHAAPSATD